MTDKDEPCADCDANAEFTARSKALEMSVSYCQTEGLLEITKMQAGKKSPGLPSPNTILKRAKLFERYLNPEAVLVTEEVNEESK